MEIIYTHNSHPVLWKSRSKGLNKVLTLLNIHPIRWLERSRIGYHHIPSEKAWLGDFVTLSVYYIQIRDEEHTALCKLSGKPRGFKLNKSKQLREWRKYDLKV